MPGDVVIYYYIEGGFEYLNRVILNVGTEEFTFEFTNRKDQTGVIEYSGFDCNREFVSRPVRAKGFYFERRNASSRRGSRKLYSSGYNQRGGN